MYLLLLNPTSPTPTILMPREEAFQLHEAVPSMRVEEETKLYLEDIALVLTSAQESNSSPYLDNIIDSETT